MNEIERILKATADQYAFTPDDLDIIRLVMVKSAFAAICDGRVAASIVKYVEQNFERKTDGK